MTPCCSPRRVVAVALTCLALLVLSTTFAADARAAEPAVDLGGRELPDDGASTDPAAPVEVTPGLWADELGPEGSAQSTHYFRYQRAITDSTVHIGVIGASRDRENTDGLEIGVAADGEECTGATASSGYSVPQGSFGASVHVGPDEAGSRDADCLTATTLDIAVSRGMTSSPEGLPIALHIVEEAPASDVSSLPEPEEDPTSEAVSSDADADELDGGASFAGAPELDAEEDGVVIDTVVATGDERLFRVPVTWGQRLQVTARVPAQEPAPEGEILSPATVDLSFVTPLRDTFQSAVSEASPSVQYYDEAAEAWDATPRVAYRNRFESTPAWVAGDYWIAVAVSPSDGDDEALEVPVELTVVVDGEESGAPSYPDTITAPGGESGPDGYAPDTPYLVGEDSFAAAPSEAGDSGFWSARRWSGVALGVLSLALVAAGVWRLATRRT